MKSTYSLIVWGYLLCISDLLVHCAKLPGGITRPIMRDFHTMAKPLSDTVFRVLQYNILADGLSGLRDDLGAFSRATTESMSWDVRKHQLLHEMLQYNPDCITLQECDHYYDFFLPKLTSYGYDGVYAPKPASACLEVSDNSDGCAIFVKRDRLRIVSSETVTYALSKAEVDDGASDVVRAMNQVGLIITCDILSKESGMTVNNGKNPLVISTTHLKAKKSSKGERYRDREVTQLLGSIDRTMKALSIYSDPVLVLTGDLNAAPDDRTTGYQAQAYQSVKAHPLGLRSILNDDMTVTEDGDVWTTWKSRWKKGEEKIAKNCIDYILYVPEKDHKAGLQLVSMLALLKREEVGEKLLPNVNYPSDHVAIAADFAVVSQK